MAETAAIGSRLSGIAGARPRHRLFAMTGFGAVAALGHAPFDLWPLTLAGLVAAFFVLAQIEGRARAFWSSWAFAFGYFAVGMNWLVEPFLVDIARHGWMAPFGITFLSGGLALLWGAAAALAVWLARPGWGRLGALALCLVLSEYVRGFLFTGFPWGMVAYAWIETPVAQMLAWSGPHGLNAVTFALAAGLAGWFVTGRGAFAVASLWAGVAGLAWALAPGPAAAPEEEAPVVRLVQSGASQREKWDPAHINRFINLQLDATAAGEAVDLTIWSEVAVPYLLSQSEPLLRGMSDMARGGTVMTGIQRFDGGLYYNSLVSVAPGGEVTDIYDKNHLVPFGEYLPFDAFLRRIGIAAIASNVGAGFAHGERRDLIDVPEIGRVMPLICYESVFAEEVGAGPRPRLIVLVTNDAWFGRFSGPYQHLAQGRARAIEQGVPMVRVAQSGVSAMIDGKGRITASIGLGESGWVDAALPPDLPPTVYARTGDLPVVLLALLGLAGTVTLRLRRNRVDPPGGRA